MCEPKCASVIPPITATASTWLSREWKDSLAVECDGDHWHGPDRYELDMARQRDLGRAGWQFVRIRGGDFYRDRAKSMEPLWTELDRLGIRPGGINKDAAEPPPPADSQRSEREEVDEAIRVEPSGDNISEDPNRDLAQPPPGPP